MSAPKSIEKSSGYTAINRVQLVQGGTAFFDLALKLIEGAKEFIHLQYYIFENDETGIQVADALMRAAERKLQVYLLVDGYASQELPVHLQEAFKKAGVQFRFFEPLLKSKYYYFGRRLHHKLLVVDVLHALVGGINISDNYNDLPGKPAWLDFALHVEGQAVRELCVLCWKTWFGYPRKMKLTPCELKPVHFQFDPRDCSRVRIRRNDWVRRKNQVTRTYLDILRQSKTGIIIVTSYFLPGKEFRKNIREAIKRGVRIRMVLSSISDVGIAKQAERHLYRWLFKNNIEVYEYLPRILHGKMALCDDQWLTLGSFNVNIISAYASIELNLDVSDPAFVGQVKQSLETLIQQECSRITPENYNAHNHFLKRIWQKICYEVVRLLFYLFTFYFRQKE